MRTRVVSILARVHTVWNEAAGPAPEKKQTITYTTVTFTAKSYLFNIIFSIRNNKSMQQHHNLWLKWNLRMYSILQLFLYLLNTIAVLQYNTAFVLFNVANVIFASRKKIV